MLLFDMDNIGKASERYGISIVSSFKHFCFRLPSTIIKLNNRRKILIRRSNKTQCKTLMQKS